MQLRHNRNGLRLKRVYYGHTFCELNKYHDRDTDSIPLYSYKLLKIASHLFFNSFDLIFLKNWSKKFISRDEFVSVNKFYRISIVITFWRIQSCRVQTRLGNLIIKLSKSSSSIINQSWSSKLILVKNRHFLNQIVKKRIN